jgi:uncharacterized LabA/DUF88 family protein
MKTKTFIFPLIESVKTAGEATQIAIDWKSLASESPTSYSELADYSYYFTTLADKFGLTEEFKESGII